MHIIKTEKSTKGIISLRPHTKQTVQQTIRLALVMQTGWMLKQTTQIQSTKNKQKKQKKVGTTPLLVFTTRAKLTLTTTPRTTPYGFPGQGNLTTIFHVQICRQRLKLLELPAWSHSRAAPQQAGFPNPYYGSFPRGRVASSPLVCLTEESGTSFAEPWRT